MGTIKKHEGNYGTSIISKITGVAKQKRLAKKKRVKKIMKGRCR
tara:strand:+ start:364 stop:495 length:132 start_codon:yes stop_codon:yes gene_type:complete